MEHPLVACFSGPTRNLVELFSLLVMGNRSVMQLYQEVPWRISICNITILQSLIQSPPAPHEEPAGFCMKIAGKFGCVKLHSEGRTSSSAAVEIKNCQRNHLLPHGPRAMRTWCVCEASVFLGRTPETRAQPSIRMDVCMSSSIPHTNGPHTSWRRPCEHV